MIKKVICPVCSVEFERFQSQLKPTSCCSPQCSSSHKKTRYIGKNNPFYGKKHNQETKNIIRSSKTKFEYKIGDKFGSLEIIGELINNRHGRLWKCRCNICNKTIKQYSYMLVNKKDCGCKFRKRKTVGYITGIFFSNIVSRARDNNIEFDLTKEYLNELFILQNMKCSLTGIDLYISPSKPTELNKTTASLDRIDSSKGYIKGNVQFLHKEINIMKLDHDTNYFIELCRMVINHADKKI